MNRRLVKALSSSLIVALGVACSDRETPTSPMRVRTMQRTIMDGVHSGNPNFLWLPPTVATEPPHTGPFDTGALEELAVEVCELSDASLCTGPLVDRMTSAGIPVPARIRLDERGERYSVNWMTGRAHVEAGVIYRVTVLRSGTVLGFLDVAVVKNTPALSTVDGTRYVGVVNGQQLALEFRIQLPTARTHVKINEVESNGGVPGDWIELFNTAGVPLSLAGYVVRDNDDSHTYTLPAGATIAPHGYYVIEEANLGFGLGSGDAARFYAPDGTSIVDSYAWTAHAVTTYGRCPDGTGALQTTTIVTKGAPNDCSIIVRINEVESSGGVPGDWAELYNAGPVVANVGGYVFRDTDDSHMYVIPAGTTIPAGGYLVLDEASFGFGLGAPDAARLFAPDGTLVDSYSWTAHAATTYGRCPNGTGEFTITVASTKGAANSCTGQVTALTWPGDPDISIVDGASVFGGNLSGLMYEASGSAAAGVLWAVRNGPGTLFRLVWNGSIWTPDPNGWAAGKSLRYGDGTGDPDSEGVTFAGAGSAAGVYVSTERNNAANGISRNSILRFDPNTVGSTLLATNEWNLTSDLPATGANLGAEGITWVPDAFLVGRGFFDESKGHVYNPAEYPNHAAGLFFVGLEVNGMIYAYALNHSDNTFTRIGAFSSGFSAVMDLSFDRELGAFWAVCDDGCGGQHALLAIDTRAGLPTSGRFRVTNVFARPVSMPNINNEGFAITSQAECVAGTKFVFWADDSETGGHAIRRGTISCESFF